jgi:G2/mitotic-specific cyclin 3/4
MHVGDDDAHTVQEITVDNCGKATLQPVGKKNRNMRGPNRNKRNKQIKRMVTHTAAIPVQKAKGAILEPKMTIKAQQELEAARVFVEKSRTEQDELHEKDVAMVAEYSDEIFEHLLSREKELKFKTVNIDQQLESFWDPRSRLMDWLVEVHNDSGLVLEILFLAVNYLDRYFSTKEDIQDLHLKLIGATSLLIASKYELDNLPYGEPVNYLVKKADGAFDESELLKAERRMLKKLDYALGWPDPMSFLRRISRADNYEPKRGTLAKYFLYITVVDKHFVGCVPSFLSAGAYCLRRYMLGKSDWVCLCLPLVVGMLIEYSRNATYITLVTH